MRSLIGWDVVETLEQGKVWRPTALTHDQWPPDYKAVYRWRHETLKKLLQDAEMLASAKKYYSTRAAEFIMDWMDTYDPRKSPTHAIPELRGDKWVPFVFFKRQGEFIEFLHDLDETQENGLVEKSRDMGATWSACGYSVHAWLFKDDDATGWGSRKQDMVDRVGDPDSIFEKMRLILQRLPSIWLPKKLIWSKHIVSLKFLNPENGSIIAGESGDNIGRGGRRSRFFKDESAHYERPELIEAALGDNTNVQIDISSVNGVGNVFHRRREHAVIWMPKVELPRGYVRAFIMDWRDHPAKNTEWYETRKARYEREGMAHIFAQEVDRNYAAALSNVVIPMDWINAAVDAHKHITYFAAAAAKGQNLGSFIAGFDVADEGVDKNALAIREWVILRSLAEWGDRDPGKSARRVISDIQPYWGRINVQYDCIGVGAGVKTEYNRLTFDEKIIDANKCPFIPWNAGAGVIKPFQRAVPDDPESIINKDLYDNLKAQGWWALRIRFYKTFKARTEGVVYPVDELISLDSNVVLLEQLKKELAQPTLGKSTRLKMLINKTPNGMKSPNLADAVMMSYFPLDDLTATAQVGDYGY